MLVVGKSKFGRVNLPMIIPSTPERIDVERLNSAPSVQIIARDAFVADTSIKLDQLQREIRLLAQELEAVKGQAAAMREDADRNERFLSFQESEQRARALKVDEIMRSFKDVKTRLDAIDGKSAGNSYFMKDLGAINSQLEQLGVLARDFRNVERKLKLSAGLFCASVLLWLVTLLAS